MGRREIGLLALAGTMIFVVVWFRDESFEPAFFVIWLVGLIGIVAYYFRRWRRERFAKRNAKPS